MVSAQEGLEVAPVLDLGPKLIEALWARNALETTIQNSTEAVITLLPEIAIWDSRLAASGQRALHSNTVDLESWRALLPDSITQNWWWHLDDPLAVHRTTLETVLKVIAGILITLALGIIGLMTQRLWMNDLEALGGIVAVGQLLFGGGLITANGRRLLHELSRRMPAAWRMSGAVTFTGAAVFLAVTLLTYFVGLPALAAWMHGRGVDAVRDHNASLAKTYLETAIRLRPSYAPSLVQLGILYEQLGDDTQAQMSFRQALESESRLVLAHYRLAELYTDAGDTLGAIRLLDYAISLLQANAVDKLVSSPDERTQMLVLLLVSRGRAFLEANQPDEALYDLVEARITADAHPDLFIPPPGEVRLTELFALQARAYDALYGLTCDEALLELARGAWREARSLADMRNTRERQWSVQATKQLNESLTCEGDQP
jgi:tetratricopeptide (TPR) repeat protein